MSERQKTQYYDLVKPLESEAASIVDINDNMDKIDAALRAINNKGTNNSGKFLGVSGTGDVVPVPGPSVDNKKDKQPAVSDPVASGTSFSFISNISQNENGVISPLKKSVPAASTSGDGLMSAADKAKLNGIQSGAQVNPGNATPYISGLMSYTDKAKLDDIADGATRTLFKMIVVDLSYDISGGGTAAGFQAMTVPAAYEPAAIAGFSLGHNDLIAYRIKIDRLNGAWGIAYSIKSTHGDYSGSISTVTVLCVNANIDW